MRTTLSCSENSVCSRRWMKVARDIAHAIGAHALLALVGKYADEAFPAGEALHVLELGAGDVGGVLEPDDQVGDVALHHLLLLDHVLDAGVLDVEIGSADLLVGPGQRLSSTVPDCSILERICSTTCLVLAISASKFWVSPSGVSRLRRDAERNIWGAHS